MDTRYKMVASGVSGGAIVIIAFVMFNLWQSWSPQPANTGHQQVSEETSVNPGSVIIKSVPTQPTDTAQQNDVTSEVQQLLQNPSTSFDASGFVQYVYAQVGVQLPRTIAEQAQVGTLIDNPNQLEKGDLVFFDLNGGKNSATFDGIYLGGNQFAAVTTHGLIAISLSDTYWIENFIYGRRIL